MISLFPVSTGGRHEKNNLLTIHPRFYQPLWRSLLNMAWVVEARDPYSGGHLWRVSQYCRLLSQALGLDRAEVARITLAGFLHDLGKVAIADMVLKKPARLSESEYEMIKTHPSVGARIIDGHPLAPLVQSSILQHHERPDGAGYPYGLDDESIDTDSRIVSICDAFDAMTSTRPYRQGMSIVKALKIIKFNLHTQFDGNFGHVFLEIARRGKFSSIIGHSYDGIPLQTCLLCGPTIALRKNQQSGDLVYCPNCGSESVVETVNHEWRITATGKRGSVMARQMEIDSDLIQELIQSNAAYLQTA
ncbi:MAG: HD domain-containing protein [Candidatus Thiodiazotropha lotti]|uniref:HD domain-containing protein n=1 Tax=Candidatus Thiodiazotropha lotti TaxID=2792787 RepID=A0A9E4K288_9GAMM|nr:HD domain-containing protein [Candidatus Thiodiazotropha lotti]MCG7929013.1 HD domain-containing protein [Candidatus Thiodiazotropha lotti]MCG7937440.1 HD domain-containing protein [Candidatus Thiodiazotropha lotti]MCG8004009.1 HD domain-containing protein [Candidatus Thiodiazotropha lotti]MCG8009069.1 HD domain-containing protein [Candidatus Thiodiazotropha lotti]